MCHSTTHTRLCGTNLGITNVMGNDNDRRDRQQRESRWTTGWRKRSRDVLLSATLLLCVAVPSVSRAQVASDVPVASPLPSPWIAQDLGDPLTTGSSVFNADADRFEISSSGEGLAHLDDQFRFVYQPLAGNVRIRARVDRSAATHRSAQAGLMIRSSLASNAAHGAVLLSAGGDLVLHSRSEAGAWATTSTRTTASAQPKWLALERVGAQVVAYSSPNGEAWTPVGSLAVALGEAAYVGIAATSFDIYEPATAAVSDVSVSGLPPWQRQANIGAPVLRGSAWHADGAYTITAGGSIGDTHDQFNFVYQTMRGDFDIAAHVASLSDRSTTAGVMIRESLTAESRHAFAGMSRSNGYLFERREQAGASSEHIDGGPGTASGWVRLARAGHRVEAFRSDDGLIWTSMGSAQLVMKQEVYVGLAAASHDTGATATVVLDGVSIDSVAGTSHVQAASAKTTAESTLEADALVDLLPGVPNLPPVVSLVSPAPGATFTAPATITLTAAAIDPEGRLTEVRFHANGNFIGASATQPYSFTWSSVPAGSYALTAIAIDADGGTTSSAAVSITVEPAPNQPPSVTLTSPTSGATYTAPATISLAATASDPENRLTRVEFYRGSTLLGSDTDAPFSFTWSSVPAGSYSLTAKAIDADGGATTSAVVSITVNASTSPARVIFTASTDHDSNVTRYLLEVFANGTDPNTGAASASSDLGKPVPDANRTIDVDRASFFNALAPGSYTAMVTAIGPYGTARSNPATFTR
jgi:regulation of enolase protein 1 (concanavalin A-like superfamily)